MARECLEDVGLIDRAESLAGELSYGDKRKVELAIVLATRSRVALLDEPMAGVSVEDIPGLADVIRRVHREFGLTMLIVEHHLEVLLELVSKVAVLHHGELLAFGTPKDIMRDERVQSAYLGAPL
jgi:branched-chain amino acid transport system ATP-binding protein